MNKNKGRLIIFRQLIPITLVRHKLFKKPLLERFAQINWQP